MLNKDVIFRAGELMTPDIAAKIAQCASRFSSSVYICHGGMDLCVDSLIGILALSVHMGSKINVGADGDDAEAALNAVCAILSGE